MPSSRELVRQLSSLRHDIAGVSRSVSRGARTRAMSVTSSGTRAKSSPASSAVRRRKPEKAVKEDPVPAIVARCGLRLFLNLVLGRKRG